MSNRDEEGDRTGIPLGEADQAVAFLALFMTGLAGRSGKKANELSREFESAITLGIFLARSQPDLAEAFARQWEACRHVDVSEHLDKMLQPYFDFKHVTGKCR